MQDSQRVIEINKPELLALFAQRDRDTGRSHRCVTSDELSALIKNARRNGVVIGDRVVARAVGVSRRTAKRWRELPPLSTTGMRRDSEAFARLCAIAAGE